VNSGEYKLMGLAPYGRPRYAPVIYDHLIDVREDGSFRLNVKYFGYLNSLQMTNAAFAELFDGPPRKPETEITQREMDIAASIQCVTEEIVLRIARFAHVQTGEDCLCLAGGVALNCVANGRLLREGPFKDIWIQPAAGDAGGAVGAALVVWHHVLDRPRTGDGVHDGMKGAYLGPRFEDDEIQSYLDSRGYPYRPLPEAEWAPSIARILAQESVVGLFQGRMEFGPRALGARSIIGDARSTKMQSVMNLKIKYRESFRPFAPACLQERVADFFELDRPTPYMLLVAKVRADRCRATAETRSSSIKEWINQVRSDVPAITHVDYSARIQSVSRETNRPFHSVIEEFEKLTGYGIVINTSFNVRGEPIVCNPEDAYRCFMRTEIDYLVLGHFLLDKKDQPAWKERTDWRKELVLD
jgi:carbamoyltransferase